MIYEIIIKKLLHTLIFSKNSSMIDHMVDHLEMFAKKYYSGVRLFLDMCHNIGV